jgi:4-amino-4-deoxy-L-arabinose transferase-like glycosyltransferase
VDEAQQKFWSNWRWWSAPALAALILAYIFRDPFIGDWDGLDYTVLALQGQPSTMALGRSLFIFTNNALYLLAHAAFGLQPENAYLLFKYAVIASGALAVIACWVLARDLTGCVRTATVAALLVTCSPTFVIYSGQVMTDVPSVLLITLALIIHLGGVRRQSLWMMLLGAALLGLGANVRETVLFYGPWLVFAPFVCGWKSERRTFLMIALCCLAFIVCAFGWFLYWYVLDAFSYRAAWAGWRETMKAEAARHPVTLRNLIPFILFFFITGPMVLIALPAAFFKEWRTRRLSPLLLMAAVGLWSNLLLIFNYSTTINWRYFLTGLPALVPLVADYFMRSQTLKMKGERRAFWSVVAGIALVTTLVGIYSKPTSREVIQKRALTRDYRERLALLPRDAVVIAGGQAIAVTYWRGIGLGQWTEIGTGAGWPGNKLAPVIEEYLKNGRRVFLDADPHWWAPCGWQLDETLELVKLESRFSFRHVSDHIYELRPQGDATARDHPSLQRLLPENRPADVQKCAGVSKLS